MKNIDKILSYILPTLKSSIVVDGITYAATINKIQLSSTFFHTDRCESCGGCDVAEDNIYTQSEYEKIMSCPDQTFESLSLDPKNLHNLQQGLHEELHEINGKTIPVYSYKLNPVSAYLPTKNKEVVRCTWIQPTEDPTKFYCKIHCVTSITCKMPHLRFIARKNTLSLCITQFGRNWAVKCPVTFAAPEDEAKFNVNKESRLTKLRILHQCATDLNITDTYLPEIISYVESATFANYLQLLGKDILHPCNASPYRCKKLFVQP